ncbi:hypothetical protein D3C80_1417160 [compost metagenome]
MQRLARRLQGLQPLTGQIAVFGQWEYGGEFDPVGGERFIHGFDFSVDFSLQSSRLSYSRGHFFHGLRALLLRQLKLVKHGHDIHLGSGLFCPYKGLVQIHVHTGHHFAGVTHALGLGLSDLRLDVDFQRFGVEGFGARPGFTHQRRVVRFSQRREIGAVEGLLHPCRHDLGKLNALFTNGG